MDLTALESLIAEWRRLTEVEREAIGRADWAEVRRQQVMKLELRAQLSDAALIFREESSATRQLRPQLKELMALESANARAVALQREQVGRALAESDRAAGQLRGLNRAYGAASGANWVSYS